MSKRDSSSRRGCATLRRPVNVRELRQRFLIVCGGEKTERNYFEAFRMPTVKVKVMTIARSPTEVVEGAHQKLLEERRKDQQYDQVWCVFDRDDFPGQDFNDAIAKAARYRIRVAYSNEAFELWYLLHFRYSNAALSRRDYIDRLNALLGHEYAKNSETMYAELERSMPDALKNAERLLARYEPANPAKDNPSTTVHLLVAQLLLYGR